MPPSRQHATSTPQRPGSLRAPQGEAREDELVRYLRGGTLSPQTPPAAVQSLQRLVGNRALTAALASGSPVPVQRASLTGILDKVFGAAPKQETLDEIALNPVAWKHFVAFARRERSTENTDYFEEYMRSKTRGGGGSNQRLYDMVMDTGDRELNITAAQRAEVRKKGEKLFWSRPLEIFEPVTKTVKGNLGDTFSRFRFDPHGKKAAQALTRGESARTKVGRFLGEKQSEKQSWVRDAEATKFDKEQEDEATI